VFRQLTSRRLAALAPSAFAPAFPRAIHTPSGAPWKCASATVAKAAHATVPCSTAGAGAALRVAPRRMLAYGKESRFKNTKKRPQVLEAERPQDSSQSSLFPSAFQQQQQQQAPAPGSTFFPGSRREEERQQGSQLDALSAGVVDHMRKVYATLAAGIGIAAGASMFAMATPLATLHPIIPGLAAMVPLLALMYTNKHTHSFGLRAGLFAAFTALSGVSLAPLLLIALKVSPAIVPQALLLTTGLFGSMTALALLAKPGAMLRWGVPLGGGLLMLMGVGIAGMFVPVTSAWYPLLHSVQMYGGLTLFTLYVAYDTQKMIDEYEMGEDDHLKHAVDLFIDFKNIFTRILILLMGRSD